MLNSITCDTSIDELIKESDISGYLDSISESVTDYTSKITKSMESEMSDGGLSLSAYNMGESSPILEACDSFLGSIDLEDVFSNFRDQALELLNEQRTKEIAKLKEKVTEKISELKEEIATLEAHLISLYSGVISALQSQNISNTENSLKSKKEELKKYEEKLQTLEGMN